MSVQVSARSDDTDRSLSNVQYRYPGSPPFRDSETDRRLFLGRDAEVDAVLHSILSFDLFLLYAESGLGKSSLLNAGVASRLRDRGLWPVSVRLNDPGRTPVEQISQQIADAGSSDPDIEIVGAISLDDDEFPDSSLWAALSALEVWRGNDLQKLVVILDQFEEIFTLGWDVQTQRQFFAEFGEVVRGHRNGSVSSRVPAPDVKFVIVIREDALGELEALSTDVPQIMRHRVRLGPLDPEHAATAIREPATIDDSSIDSEPFQFSDEAVEEIIEFLRTQTVRGSTVRSAAVDPSQLQIICQYVERVLVPLKSEDGGRTVRIERADLGGRAGLDRVLSEFYRRTIDGFDEDRTGPLRELCETGLINDNERRLSRELDEIAAVFGVEQSELEALVDARLLRAEPRVGSVYFELAHDTLVAPILADRAERRAAAQARTQRRFIIAGLMASVGLVIAAAVLFVVASNQSNDRTRSNGPVTPDPTLEIGETLSAVIGPPPFVEYLVEALPDAELVVEVESAALDLGIEVTDASGATRRLDQGAAGEAERMVIMRSDGEPERRVRITNAGGDGSFSVTLTQGSTKLLDVGSEEPAVIGSDDVLLFSIPTERGIVGLVPLDSGAGLDVTIELLGQGARDNGVIVDAGDVQVPEWIIDPPPDVSLIAVRSKATSGVLSVRHVAIEDRLSAGDELIGEELSAGSPTAYYVIDELGSEASGIILNSDQDVTPFAQVFSSGSPKPVVIYPYFVSSLGSVAVLAESTQPSILSVQRSSPEGDGFFPGEPDPPFDGRFDLSVVRVETLDPRDEDPVQGDGLGLYDVDIPTPSGDVTSDKPELQVIATPTSGGSIDLSLFDAAGYPESSSSSSNAIRFPFPGWIPAELFIGVRSDAFEVEVRGPDVIPIRESPYRQSVMEGGLFTVDLPQDTYRTVAVRPGNATSDWAVAVYRDPLLQPILRQDFATDYLTTLGCEGAGLHTIALRRYAIDFDSSAAAADLVVAPATADDCPATAATPFSNSEIGADIYGLLVNEGAPDEAAICITSALLESPGEDALAELGVLELQPEAIELAGQAALDCDVPESFIDQFVTALIG